VTVLGYRFWQRQFGGDPSVLGRKLQLNGKVRTVIGVMPPRFMWRGADVYLPDVFHRGQPVEGVQQVHLLGRLKPGITREQATAALEPLIQEMQRQHPDEFPASWRIQLRDFGETFPSGIRRTLWILFGAVGLLLLIACLNVSNLLLSRAMYRRREIAIRGALGARRGRLIRQLLAESLVLALAGGAIGVGLAVLGLRAIVAIVPPDTIPDEAEIALNLPVLLFSLSVSVASALLAGLAPALHLTGDDLITPLKEAGRGASGSLRQRLFRNAFVVGEIALSLMLLVGASLMLRTLISIEGSGLMYHPERTLTLRIPFSEQRYPDAARRSAFLQEALRRLKDLPGAQAVGINSGMPPVYNWQMRISLQGQSRMEGQFAMLHQTNADYLRVAGVPLVQGRFLTEQEVNAGMHSMVVNQTFMRRYLAGQDRLGQIVHVLDLQEAPFHLSNDAFQIVGVARDAINRVATREIVPEMYVPYTITAYSDRIFVLGPDHPESLERAVKAQIFAVDPGQPVMDVKPMDRLLAENAYSRPRFNLFLFGVFAALGLLLALCGIYGVISQAVAQQTREIGIRMALGASYGQVTGHVLQGATKLLSLGILIGLGFSSVSVRALSGVIAGSAAFDPYSFAGMALLLFAAGLLASFLPARRAASVDPVTALRQE
jgi:putative ABC transport system permease protein